MYSEKPVTSSTRTRLPAASWRIPSSPSIFVSVISRSQRRTMNSMMFSTTVSGTSRKKASSNSPGATDVSSPCAPTIPAPRRGSRSQDSRTNRCRSYSVTVRTFTAATRRFTRSVPRFCRAAWKSSAVTGGGRTSAVSSPPWKPSAAAETGNPTSWRSGMRDSLRRSSPNTGSGRRTRKTCVPSRQRAIPADTPLRSV